MSSPMISFQVPYDDNEQRFLTSVVQAAVREYRNRNSQPNNSFQQARRIEDSLPSMTSSSPASSHSRVD